MKKRLILLVALAFLTGLVSQGCSNKNIDTAKVREALQSLTGGPKDSLEQALKNIDQGNFTAAVRPLKTIAYTVKLSKDQRIILEDTITKAEAKAAKQ